MQSVADLATLEHQMFRDHEYDPVGCLDCKLARMASEDLRARFEFSDYNEGSQSKLVTTSTSEQYPVCVCGHECGEHDSGYTCQQKCDCLEYRAASEEVRP